MVAKFVVLAGVLGAGGYYAYKTANVDPTVFPYSREQAQSMLADARTSLPRRDGSGQIQLWGAGRTAKGVTLNMRYAPGAPLLRCEAIVTAIAPDKSRVLPDCGSPSRSDSALARTENETRVPMFEEHIQATLNKRPFNRETVDRKESAAVMRNLGGLQREALQRADEEAQLMDAGSRR